MESVVIVIVVFNVIFIHCKYLDVNNQRVHQELAENNGIIGERAGESREQRYILQSNTKRTYQLYNRNVSNKIIECVLAVCGGNQRQDINNQPNQSPLA